MDEEILALFLDNIKDVDLSFQDSYFNLTQKLLMTLQWLVEAGQGVTFTMKCDDDTFIDGKRLLSQFDSLPHSNLYYGYFSGNTFMSQLSHRKHAHGLCITPQPAIAVSGMERAQRCDPKPST